MRFLSISFLIILLYSCQREPDFVEPNPNRTDSLATPPALGTKGQMYFTVNAADSSIPTLGKEVTLTGCFDIEKDSVLWLVRDSFVLTSSPFMYSGTSNRNPYYDNIVDGDAIYRIFCPQRYDRTHPFNPLMNTFYLGVYFEKLNRKTGKREQLVSLLPQAELSSSNQFGISRLVYDSTLKRFFFGANNGFLYCVSLDGSIAWKTAGYLPLLHNDNQLNAKLSNLYGAAGKLVMTTASGKINAYNMLNGNLIWSKNGPPNPPAEELHVSNKYVFPFHSNGYNIQRLDINTGNPTTTDPYFGGISTSLPNYPGFIVPYNVHINDSTIVFWGSQGSWLYVEDLPDWPGGILQNASMNGDCKYFPAYPNYLFGWDFLNGCNGLQLRAVNYQFDTSPWQWQIAGSGLACTLINVPTIAFFDGRLSIVTSFRSGFNSIYTGNIYIARLDPESGVMLGGHSEVKLMPKYSAGQVYGVKFVK
jgi:hypothetical protein